jgi:phosphate-selective porin OprO and OprP
MRNTYWTRVVIGACFATAGYSHAAEAVTSPKPSPSIYDTIWKHTEWYKNEDNPVIQSFQFTGRFQLDYAIVESDQGDHDEWNIRRFRLGGKAKLLHDFTFHGEADLNPQEASPVYERLTDMYLAWSRSKTLKLTVGKHSASFTMDGSTSSKELLAIDRGNLANNLWFPQEYFPGVSASGEVGNWRYHSGVYSSGRMNKGFGDFSGGAFGLATLGYDFGKALQVKQALLAVNYVYNEPDSNNTFTRSLRHIGSVNFSYDTGKWGFRTDLTGGDGYLGQSDMWGAMLMPFYNITDHLQVVTRLTHIESETKNGIRLARYESEVVSGRGDEYNEVYLGLNYYLYGHKLKLQTGGQYAEMRDPANDGGAYSGWAWTVGLRIGW